MSDGVIADAVVVVGTAGSPPPPPLPPLQAPCNSLSPEPGSIFSEQDCGNGMINGLGRA